MRHVSRIVTLGAVAAILLGSWTSPAIEARRPRPQQPPRASRAENDLLVTASLDRIKLPQPPKKFTVDALGRRIRIQVGPSAAAFAAQFRSGLVRACPTATVDGSDVVLDCLTPRFTARIDTERGEAYLTVRQLRGIPWKGDDDGPPMFHHPEVPLCPGETELAGAECAFLAGRLDDAHRRFRALAAVATLAAYSNLRLGDIAAARDSLVEAVSYWNRTGNSGPVYRLARARLCELSGDCLGRPQESNVFDEGGLPDPWRAEMELRRLRQLAFRGRVSEMASRAAQRARQPLREPLCAQSPALCLKLIGPAMEDPASTGADEALEFYLTVPGRDKGPRASHFAAYAARISERNGAPAFGANLMAVTTASVPPAQLAEHLQRTLELFIKGNDLARGRLIAAYAKVKLPRTRLSEEPWPTLLAAASDEFPEAPDGGPPANAGNQATGAMASLEDLLGPGRASVEEEIKAAQAASARARAGNQPALDGGTP